VHGGYVCIVYVILCVKKREPFSFGIIDELHGLLYFKDNFRQQVQIYSFFHCSCRFSASDQNSL